MKRSLILLMLISATFSFSQLSEDWFGKYRGELNTTSLSGISMTYNMEMEISAISDTSYNFIIIYGEDSTRQERAYQLYDNGPNHFILDEQNGILLDMSYGMDRLVSVFEIQGSVLHVSYIREKKGIRFELTSSKKSFQTGDNIHEGVKQPLIFSYNTSSFQEAYLKKLK
jgi:hypothetical protein